MARMRPATKTSIVKGEIRNSAGINQFTNRPKELGTLAKARCLEVASQVVERLIEIAFSDEPRFALVAIKEILDRALGRPHQSIAVEGSNTQTLSSQQTLEVLDRAIKQQEENEALVKEILELKEQLKWVNEKPAETDSSLPLVAEEVEDSPVDHSNDI